MKTQNLNLQALAGLGNIHPIRRIILIVLALIALGVSTASATEGDDRTLSPYFFVQGADGTDAMPLVSTSTDVKIAGVIADIKITQIYKNDGKLPLEALYVFPGSTQAAVYGLTMSIGDRKIKAKIKEKEKARAEYNKAVKEGKRVSLLEQSRPNVFQMNLANIMPGDVIKVELSYTELIIPTDGVYEVVCPTVVGPRYSEAAAEDASAEDKFVETPYTSAGEVPTYQFNLRTFISTGIPVQSITCPTHKIKTKYKGLNKAYVSLDASEKNGGNRDFVLQYQLKGKKIESGLMLYEGKNENFFLMMLQPPKRVKPEQIPPREYIFIVDVSGSMRGFPLEVSKKLLRDLVIGLRPTDKFNVLFFAGASGAISDTSLAANEANITWATEQMSKYRGGGGTRLLPALKNAMKLPRSKALSRTVVIVTDGYVSVEKQAFDLINQNLNNTNFFTFGIGSSVNRYLIEGMASVGQGEPFFVLDHGSAPQHAEKFRKYIESPVLTQIKIDYPGFEAYDIEPLSTPDLFANRPIIVYGKYKGKPSGKVKVTGFSGMNPYSAVVKVEKSMLDSKNSALPYLWARKKIQQMDDYKSVYNDPNYKNVITQLGLDYNLLTQYTSFIAVDSKRVNKKGALKKVNQPLPLPQGVSNSAVGGGMGFDPFIEGVSSADGNGIAGWIYGALGSFAVLMSILGLWIKRLF